MFAATQELAGHPVPKSPAEISMPLSVLLVGHLVSLFCSFYSFIVYFFKKMLQLELYVILHILYILLSIPLISYLKLGIGFLHSHLTPQDAHQPCKISLLICHGQFEMC